MILSHAEVQGVQSFNLTHTEDAEILIFESYAEVQNSGGVFISHRERRGRGDF